MAKPRHVGRRLVTVQAPDITWAVRKDSLGPHPHDELRAVEFGKQRIVVIDAGASVHAQSVGTFEVNEE